MIGQYSEDELIAMDYIVSSVKQFKEGLIIRIKGDTVNYYLKESDGSWTNYLCRSFEP